MSKHKRLHSINGKGKFSSFAGFVGDRYDTATRHPKRCTPKKPPSSGLNKLKGEWGT